MFLFSTSQLALASSLDRSVPLHSLIPLKVIPLAVSDELRELLELHQMLHSHRLKMTLVRPVIKNRFALLGSVQVYLFF